MGLVNGQLTLKNPRRPDLSVLQVQALADTGALFLSIPQSICDALDLEVIEHKLVTLADGTHRTIPYAGPLEVRFKNRVGYFGAIVLGDQVLLGAIPMEDMDLVVIPKTRQLDVNPLHPDCAQGFALTILPPPKSQSLSR